METGRNPKAPTEFHLPSVDGSERDIVATYTPSTGRFTANVSEKEEEIENLSSSDFQIFAEDMREYAIITEKTEDAMLEAHRAAAIISSEPDRSMRQTFQLSDRQRFHVMYMPKYEVYMVDMLKFNENGSYQIIQLDKRRGVQSIEELQKLIPVKIPEKVVRNLILDREANMAFKENLKNLILESGANMAFKEDQEPKAPGRYTIPGNKPNLMVMVIYEKEKDAMIWMLVKDGAEVIERSNDDVAISTVDDLMEDIFSIGIVTWATEDKMRKEIDDYRGWKNGITPSANIAQEPEIETAHGR